MVDTESIDFSVSLAVRCIVAGFTLRLAYRAASDLHILAVRPKFDGLGLGSLLIKAGLEVVDAASSKASSLLQWVYRFPSKMDG